jgi:hypothetical protein
MGFFTWFERMNSFINYKKKNPKRFQEIKEQVRKEIKKFNLSQKSNPKKGLRC